MACNVKVMYMYMIELVYCCNSQWLTS